jgi:nucleoid DNA-binding protein
MRKSEFVAKVAEVAGMTQRDTEKVIDALRLLLKALLKVVKKSACRLVSLNRK